MRESHSNHRPTRGSRYRRSSFVRSGLRSSLDDALLASAGACLVLTQYIAAREIGSTFFSTEIVLLLTTVIMLAGPSIGYSIAHRPSERALVAWGTAAFALQLALPTGLRAVVGVAAPRGVLAIVLIVALTVVGFAVASFYAVFLPRRAASLELARLYAFELAGGVVALAAIAVAPSHRWVIALHAIASATVLAIIVERRVVAFVAAAAGTVAIALYPAFDRSAAHAYYAGYHGLVEPRVIVSEYSPYQRIDIVDDALGSRSLFLDGVYFFRSRAVESFNVFLAEVPGALRSTRGDALVVGSGSFLSAALLQRLGYHVTVLELDEAVARLGFFHFADVHRLVPGALQLQVGDARRHLARASESYDVIVLDVPAPYHLQTALLHSAAFYRTVSGRLRSGGIAAMSLCGDSDAPVARAIIASAAATFPAIAIAQPTGSSVGFLYAGNVDVPTLRADIARRGGGNVLDDGAARALATRAIDEGNLGATLLMAREPLREMVGAN
jgi:spermidine synthase